MYSLLLQSISKSGTNIGMREVKFKEKKKISNSDILLDYKEIINTVLMEFQHKYLKDPIHFNNTCTLKN